ncbi:hypothetical protein SEA_ENNEA_10 [Gordonia phage Ennea]|uniref:Uncharacterized protein n=1 Tax=Gordonia Phage Lollipop1437 TaxID=2588505 RepID=A0A4Y6EK60_9CAUD|nr:hypothetical protein KNU64_gp09 [Gordonia Phage Lollipop1437]QDF19113.1 hypothetical protein SEA_LOLLIPOP1437_9 [Gordonia Phage Lollipop1437]QRI45246.1 hypothetical protein SEA_ENNEA_10 [Gordonia phage Ennea]
MTEIAPLDSAPVFTRETTTTKVFVAISGVPDIRGRYHSKPIRPDSAELTFEEAGDKSWNQRPRVHVSISGFQIRKDGSTGQNRTTLLNSEVDVLPWMREMIEVVRPSTHPKTEDEEIG